MAWWGHGDGSYQVEGALELDQHVLAAAAGILQLAQRVLEGSVPQLGRERAQAHEVTLLLLLLLRFKALHSRGQLGCGRGAAEVAPPPPSMESQHPPAQALPTPPQGDPSPRHISRGL